MNKCFNLLAFFNILINTHTHTHTHTRIDLAVWWVTNLLYMIYKFTGDCYLMWAMINFILYCDTVLYWAVCCSDMWYTECTVSQIIMLYIHNGMEHNAYCWLMSDNDICLKWYACICICKCMQLLHQLYVCIKGLRVWVQLL